MFGLAAPQQPSLRTCLHHDKPALRGYLRFFCLHVQLTNQSAQATTVLATNQVARFIDTEYSHHELWQAQLWRPIDLAKECPVSRREMRRTSQREQFGPE